MRKRKIISIFLATTVFFSVVTCKEIIVQATSNSDVQNKIDDNNAKKNQLQQEKNKVEDQKAIENDKLNAIQDKLQEKSNVLASTKSQVSSYENNINSLESKLSGIVNNIVKLNSNIKKSEDEIKKKEEEAKAKEELLGKRIRSMYKTNYMDKFIVMLLEAKDFSDLISRADNFSKIVNNDKQLIEDVNDDKEELLKTKKQLDEKKVTLDKQKNEVANKKQELQSVQLKLLDQKNEYESQYSDIQDMEKQKTALIDGLSQKQKDIQDEIGDLASYNQQLQKQLDDIFAQAQNNNSGSKSGDNIPPSSGGFMRPVAGGYISCKYGPRTHPVTGVAGFHTGIDLAVPMETPIYAAQSGVVAVAQWNNAYGNMVIINHANGIQTLYGHSQRYIVSPGEKVKKGQVIAYVGTTGLSTGPHLHYEVRKNGSHINPGGYM